MFLSNSLETLLPSSKTWKSMTVMADVRFTKKLWTIDIIPLLSSEQDLILSFTYSSTKTLIIYNVLFYVLLLTVKNVKDIEKMMLHNNSKMISIWWCFMWVILAIVAEKKITSWIVLHLHYGIVLQFIVLWTQFLLKVN